MSECIIIDKKMSDGWHIREIVYSGYTGHNHYYYLNKRAPVVKVGEEKIAKQYAGYTLIEKDLRSVLVWLNEIKKIDPKHFTRAQNPQIMDLVKGYFVAALTFYGKCFTTTKGRGIKYDRKDVSEKYKNIHDIIMEMRHNFSAHSGIGFESVNVSLVLHPDINSDMKPRLYTELRQPDFALELVKEMVILVEELQQQSKNKREILADKFLNDIVLPKGKVHWYSKSTYDELPNVSTCLEKD